MGILPNKILIYKFNLKTKTPLRIGGDDDKEILKDRDNNPILFGSSLGGAIRAYLENIYSKEEVFDFMGGREDGDEIKFIQSQIIIEDAKIIGKVETKEGTKIDGKFGSAEYKMKYIYDYIEPNANITFNIEVQSSDEKYELINNMMCNIAYGFNSGNIKLGSQKNNNFGLVNIISLKKHYWNLETVEGIKQYIDNKDNEDILKWETVDYKVAAIKDIENNDFEITMTGVFPYGVYQNFKENGVMGLKNNLIPASSIKGLLRHNFEKILNNTNIESGSNEETINKKIEFIFGNNEKSGTIQCFDVNFLGDPQYNEIEIINTDESKDEENKEKESKEMVYVKIDRFTGGNIDKALLKQKENRGEAVIKVKVKNEKEKIKSGALLPILYTILEIGNGRLPIGGKTSIGLGEFKAETIEIKHGNAVCNDYICEEEDRFILNKNAIKPHFKNFLKLLKEEN